MRQLILKIIHLLDGTPATYGQRQNGQTLVEMALITPILIVMLMGMVEIGWFANNYLTLLDVARAGARRGAVLQDQNAPLEWDELGSYVPLAVIQDNDYRDQGLNIVGSASIGRISSGAPEDTLRANARSCDISTLATRGFYTELLCVMRASLSPLSIDIDNHIDDIVISGFSLARITDPAGGNVILGTNARPAGTADTHVVVVGRYPTTANECDVTVTNPTGAAAFAIGAREPRDPFDFNQNNQRDMRAADSPTNTALGNGLFTERAGYDAIGTNVATAEKQVGYSYTGQHWIAGTGCLGSEWTIAEIEALVNLPTYQMTNEQRRTMLPHQGMVMVEIFWEHEMLLRFPVFNPVVNAFAGDQTPTIGVWAAFPLPSVEPSSVSLGLP